jgi:hypothetical protein
MHPQIAVLLLTAPLPLPSHSHSHSPSLSPTSTDRPCYGRTLRYPNCGCGSLCKHVRCTRRAGECGVYESACGVTAQVSVLWASLVLHYSTSYCAALYRIALHSPTLHCSSTSIALYLFRSVQPVHTFHNCVLPLTSPGSPRRH